MLSVTNASFNFTIASEYCFLFISFSADKYANYLVLALFESELDPAEKTLLEFIIKKTDTVNNFKKYILFLFKK